MGLFDSVFAFCPQCGHRLEFQSKAGECRMDSFSLHDVPPVIAGELNGALETCKCGITWRFVTTTVCRLERGV